MRSNSLSLPHIIGMKLSIDSLTTTDMSMGYRWWTGLIYPINRTVLCEYISTEAESITMLMFGIGTCTTGIAWIGAFGSIEKARLGKRLPIWRSAMREYLCQFHPARVAEKLGISRDTVDRLCKRNVLRRVVISPRRVYIDPDSLRKMLGDALFAELFSSKDSE